MISFQPANSSNNLGAALQAWDSFQNPQPPGTPAAPPPPRVPPAAPENPDPNKVLENAGKAKGLSNLFGLCG